MQQRWPVRLWVVRHGESLGNVANAAARAAGRDRLGLDLRDADVPLSDLGRQQATALGEWFGGMPLEEKPEVVLVSPYLRARQTAELIAAEARLSDRPDDFVRDERLREKEFGILDLLTESGIAQFHPEQARFRAVLGKFYHRPPGGESWCDVILRLRSLLDTVALHYAGRRALVVTHQVVLLCLRYLLERLSEEEILAIDCQGDIANCGVTEYGFDPTLGRLGGMRLLRYNFVTPVKKTGTPVTAEPRAKAEVR